VEWLVFKFISLRSHELQHAASVTFDFLQKINRLYMF